MTSKALRQVVIGLQADPGTGVVPDFALRAMISLEPKVDKIVVEEDIGSFAPGRHYIGSVMPEGSLSVDGALYEEIPHFISMAMGIETPAGGGSPFTWTWDLPDDLANSFALYSVEYTDGGTWVVRAIDVFSTGLTISGEATKAWKVECSLAGGETTYATALTGTPAPLTTNGVIRMADTLCYIDALYANLGVTQMAELISFTWKLEALQHFKQFAGSLYPNGRGNDKWQVSLEVLAEVENAVMADLKADLLTTTQVAVRIAATSAPFSATIDGNYFVQKVKSIEDRDGNNTVSFSLIGEKDASDNTGSVVVLSSLAAL